MEFLILALVAGFFGDFMTSQDEQGDQDNRADTSDDMFDTRSEGSERDDTIALGALDNFHQAGDGDDTLFGGAGMDEIHGQAGDDRIFLGDGNDHSHFEAGQDPDNYGAGDDFIRGGAGDDRIWDGLGTNTLYGDTGADDLVATDPLAAQGTDTDIVFGGYGADTIVGDDGDVLSGQSGTDTFHVAFEFGDEVVVIEDFDAKAGEVIEFSFGQSHDFDDIAKQSRGLVGDNGVTPGGEDPQAIIGVTDMDICRDSVSLEVGDKDGPAAIVGITDMSIYRQIDLVIDPKDDILGLDGALLESTMVDGGVMLSAAGYDFAFVKGVKSVPLENVSIVAPRLIT